MLLTELDNLAVEVTQLTPHIYGENTPGASLSFKATVKSDEIELVENGSDQMTLWGEDDGVSVLTRIMNGSPFEIMDLELPVKVASSNGGALLSITADKIKVGSAKPKAGRLIEFGFSISWHNDQENLYAAQLCVKRGDLSLSTGGDG